MAKVDPKAFLNIGDYFGILMDERVTSFPFNVNENPMYNGTVMIFLGTALWYVICIRIRRYESSRWLAAVMSRLYLPPLG